MSNELVNEYLTSIFNNVLIIEENSLKTSRFKDLSIKEMHTLDVVGTIPDCTPSDVARTLMVTLGTVTASLNRLEAKGYLERIRSNKDRRVVHLYLTKKGRLIYRLHRKFHQRMVEQITDGMSEDEYAVMQKGLLNLHAFLEELK
ncbi:MarR family winged helix-turn-helix transcriptional regulator [Streptococcus merionis]|uniref:fatty acid biosynthesis transcriptional regulator FabT n=1 Tax=Streptococcus merionis TaxID=400065 RepID=UPI0026EAF8B8|nr:MarR family transcriptional regulator [Streptococcus merionis]